MTDPDNPVLRSHTLHVLTPFHDASVSTHRCPSDAARLVGTFCATWLEQIDQAETLAAQMMVSSSPQEHFDLIYRRLHCTSGGAALMGIVKIREPITKLEFAMQEVVKLSGVSGVIRPHPSFRPSLICTEIMISQHLT